MNTKVCPKCGSKQIFQGTIRDGVLTGYTTRDVCRDCEYQGNPIIFTSEKDYKKFLINLSKKKNVEIKSNERVHLQEDTDNIWKKIYRRMFWFGNLIVIPLLVRLLVDLYMRSSDLANILAIVSFLIYLLALLISGIYMEI